MDEDKKPIYDDIEAMNFIHKQTHYPRIMIRKMMNAELRYMQNVGIIDWDDLDEYIAWFTNYTINELVRKIKNIIKREN